MDQAEYKPGPYDQFRGVIEIDCYECLSPEQKAKFRIGKFVPVGEVGGDVPPIPGAPKTSPEQSPPES